jgi:hypothetical protein
VEFRLLALYKQERMTGVGEAGYSKRRSLSLRFVLWLSFRTTNITQLLSPPRAAV